MKIEGIEVTGIKRAVSDVRRECTDRWAIVLDMSDWSVREIGLIGQDYYVESSSEFQIAGGNANSDYITMDELKDKIARVIKCYRRASAEYDKGVRHAGAYDPETKTSYETKAEYIRTCINDEMA